MRLVPALGLLLILSCSKDKAFSIYGKWDLIEVYNGDPAWGGCNCWAQPNASEAHTMQFNVDGSYQLTRPAISSASSCNGVFQLQGDTAVILSSCSSWINDDFTITTEGNFLILESTQMAALFRYKYRRIN